MSSLIHHCCALCDNRCVCCEACGCDHIHRGRNIHCNATACCDCHRGCHSACGNGPIVMIVAIVWVTVIFIVVPWLVLMVVSMQSIFCGAQFFGLSFLVLIKLINDASCMTSILTLFKIRTRGTWSSGRVLWVSAFFWWCFFGIEKISAWSLLTWLEVLLWFKWAHSQVGWKAVLECACEYAMAWAPVSVLYKTSKWTGSQHSGNLWVSLGGFAGISRCFCILLSSSGHCAEMTFFHSVKLC